MHYNGYRESDSGQHVIQSTIYKKISFFERSHTPSESPEQSGLHSFQFHKRLLYKNLAYFDADAISIRVD